MDGDGWILLALAVVFAAAAATFFWLWQKEKRSNRLFVPKDKDEEEENEYEEEILNIIDEGHKHGAIMEEEAQMISNIFEFGDKEVREIMRFRKKIVGIDVNTPLHEAVSFMLGEIHSRFPVYEEDIDNIVGIIHIREAFTAYFEGKDKTIKELSSEPFYIHGTKEVSDLFKEMQAEKIHMAVVVDEYGQTEGIVCMEDILEIIVGKIMDEYDVEEREIINLANQGEYLVEGLTRLDELEEILSISFPDEDIETLNGFLVNRLGRLPVENERITITYKGFDFKSIEVKNHGFKQVQISKIEKDEK